MLSRLIIFQGTRGIGSTIARTLESQMITQCIQIRSKVIVICFLLQIFVRQMVCR